MLRDVAGAVTAAVIVESQLATDPTKRASWPVYIATTRARLACPTSLLVVVPDRSVARWARHPIETGHPGFVLSPIVICLEDLPHLSSLPAPLHTPELALLCVLGHPEIDEAEAALSVIHAIDDDRARLYWDIILAHLPALTRQTLESQMEGYKYQSEFARKYYGQGHDEGLAEGREEGREEGMQQAAIDLATAKLATMSADLAGRIRSVRDIGVLAHLIVALGQARDSAEVLAALDATVPAAE